MFRAENPAFDPSSGGSDDSSAERQWLAAVQALGLQEPLDPILPPETRDALREEVQAQMAAGDYQAALRAAWALAYDDPLHRDDTLDFALCLQHVGDLPAACRFYATALVMDPTDAYCIYRLGECLETLGEVEEAREAYLAAVEMARMQDSGSDSDSDVVRHAEQRLAALN